MKTAFRIVLVVLIGMFLVGVVGCGKSADVNEPVSEVQAEAEGTDMAAP